MTASGETPIPAEVVRQLSLRSDAKGGLQLGAHLSLLLVAANGLQQLCGSGWEVVGLLGYGAVLTFLFAPLHETIHNTAFRRRGLNKLVAMSIGFVLLIPARYFREFHFSHHRHTQDRALDPELARPKPTSRRAYWLMVSGLPFWWNNVSTIVAHARGRVTESYIRSARHSTIITEARYHLAGYCALLIISMYFANALLWWYWVLPALLTQPLLRLFLLAEHTGCDYRDDMLSNSRTTYTSALVNFLAWNMPYHAEHHLLASIPFHALPALHAYSGALVKYKGDGYFRVHRELVGKM